MDRLWRIGLGLAHRVLRVWWFLARPDAHGAYVALWYEGRVLVIRNSYKPGVTLPCGAIGRGETPRECALRELREEVGIDLSPGSLREAGRYVATVYHRRDHATVFETTVERKPRVAIDRREVVWADFRTAAELRRLPLVPHLLAYLDQRNRDRGDHSGTPDDPGR